VRRYLWLIGWVGASLLLLVMLAIWQGRAYVDYSDGVYAESARLVVHGLVPYRDFAAAQPPGVFYAGALILALGDSIQTLRFGLAVVDLALALLVLAVVWRLTGRRTSAAVAGLVALITPWALLEHAQLLPETFAAPLLVIAILAAGGRRSSWLAGIAGALAGLFKIAFFLPALALAAAAAAPALALGALAGTALAGFAASGVAFGAGFWRQTFEAQSQTGLSTLHYAGGLWFQGAWNLAPLAIPAAFAVRERAKARHSPQFRVVVAAAVGSLGLLFSLFKRGSYLNVLVTVEPALLILAICGWTWLLERRRLLGRYRAIALSAVFAILGVTELASLLLSPQDASLFGRPLAASAPGWSLTGPEVSRQVALIEHCPLRLAYSGPPYLAFVAGRRMPGNQPDQFIIQNARSNLRFLAAASHDQRHCP